MDLGWNSKGQRKFLGSEKVLTKSVQCVIKVFKKVHEKGCGSRMDSEKGQVQNLSDFEAPWYQLPYVMNC